MSARREFLSKFALPGLLGLAVGEHSGAAEALLPEGEAGEQEGLVRLRRRAMGCDFEIYVRRRDEKALRTAQEALSILEPLEQQMSIFRQDSELNEMNRRAFAQPVLVEKRLFDLLCLARRLGEETGGAFDITGRPLTRVWLEAQGERRPPSAAEIEQVRRKVGVGLVALDAEAGTLRFLAEGVELDLGAIGKGYAVDRVVELLEENGVEEALVHAGFSSVRATGTGPDGKGWAVGIRRPMGAQPGSHSAATVYLRRQAMGTSASQRPACEGAVAGPRHLIDPRSGYPVAEALSATAFAPSAAQADALSTAFCIMGVVATREYCRRHAESAALLLLPGAAAGQLQAVKIGVTQDEVEVLI